MLCFLAFAFVLGLIMRLIVAVLVLRSELR